MNFLRSLRAGVGNLLSSWGVFDTCFFILKLVSQITKKSRNPSARVASAGEMSNFDEGNPQHAFYLVFTFN